MATPDPETETLERFYAAWEHGDFTVGVPDFAPDATLAIDPEIPDAGEYRGFDEISAYMRRFLEPWVRLTIVPESIERIGDGFLVRVRQDGVGRESGAAVGFSYFHAWTFREGKVTRLESVLREDVAREALTSRGEGPPRG